MNNTSTKSTILLIIAILLFICGFGSVFYGASTFFGATGNLGERAMGTGNSVINLVFGVLIVFAANRLYKKSKK